MAEVKGQMLSLVICHKADYSSHNGSGAEPERNSTICLLLKLSSRIKIASGQIINGHIWRQV